MGIYLGNGYFTHSSTSNGVMISNRMRTITKKIPGWRQDNRQPGYRIKKGDVNLLLMPSFSAWSAKQVLHPAKVQTISLLTQNKHEKSAAQDHPRESVHIAEYVIRKHISTYSQQRV